MNDKNNGGLSWGTLAIIVIAILFCLSSCSGGGSSSRKNVAYDPDGFMGYSDSFWEWQAKQ